MMTGRLKGMCREAECTVSAVKVFAASAQHWGIRQLRRHFAPENLPDGQYEVTFEGRTIQVKKLDGVWLDGRM
jgi:hypothetical protein